MQRDSCTFAPPNDLLAPPTFVVLFTGEREDTGRPKRSRCLLHHPVLTYCSTNTQPDDSGCVGDGPVWCTGWCMEPQGRRVRHHSHLQEPAYQD